MIKIVPLILLATFLIGCSIYRINSEDVAEKNYEPKDANKIVYLEEVTQPYDVVGFITVNTERRQSVGEVIEKMKKEAGNLGGDAITEITVNSTGSWKKLPPQQLMSNAYIRANFTATVIAFRDNETEKSNDIDKENDKKKN